MSHWLQDFFGILWFTRLLKPPPTSSYRFSVRFSGRLLELWLRVIVGTTLRFGDAFWSAGDTGTIRCPDGEVEVKVTLEKGKVGKLPPPVLVLSWKALLKLRLRFSMEW